MSLWSPPNPVSLLKVAWPAGYNGSGLLASKGPQVYRLLYCWLLFRFLCHLFFWQTKHPHNQFILTWHKLVTKCWASQILIIAKQSSQLLQVFPPDTQTMKCHGRGHVHLYQPWTKSSLLSVTSKQVRKMNPNNIVY